MGASTSATSAQSPDALLEELKGLLSRAQGFKTRYDDALRRFQQSSSVWRVISGKVLDYIEEGFDLERSRLDQAEQAFFTAWEQSPQYRQIVADLGVLIGSARDALARVYRSPPSLREVHRAVRPQTKASRLASVLAIAVDELAAWMKLGKKLPIRRIRKRSVAKRTGSPRTLLPRTWWEWLSILVAFVVLVLSFPTLLGVTRGIAILLSLLVVGLLLGLDLALRKTFT